jgi:RNA polymerase sigma-70 factor (ECF subfamily)
VPERTDAADLIRRLRAGDPAATCRVYDAYARRLVELADARLGPRLAGRLDGEDVVQSVFRTFFRRAGAGEFHLDDPGALWALLIRITVNKVRQAARYHTAGVRNATREARAASPDADLLADALVRGPGPAEAAHFADLLGRLAAAHSPLHGRVLELRLAGCGPSEIADELKVTRQTVHRHLTRMGDWLKAEGELSGEDE